MKTRGFEIVKAYENKGINLPIRKTKYSAGYDIEAAEDIVVPAFKPGTKPTLVPTGVKAYMEDDEYLMLVNRSSGPKKGLVMPNAVGIVDKDYYNNESNEGLIYFQFINISDKDYLIHKGDAIGQGIFQKFEVVDDDNAKGVRKGAFGSTDKK